MGIQPRILAKLVPSSLIALVFRVAVGAVFPDDVSCTLKVVVEVDFLGGVASFKVFGSSRSLLDCNCTLVAKSFSGKINSTEQKTAIMIYT